MKIAVIGGGSWGTALSLSLIKNKHDVSVYVRRQEQADEINSSKENKKYLPGITIPDNLLFSCKMDEVVRGKSIVLFTVPAQSFRENVEKAKDYISPDSIIINVSKGIEITTLKLISQISEEILPSNPYVDLSGPSHAEEVSRGMPTTLVSASRSRVAAEIVQDIFSSDRLRVYTNPDVVGVEVGGALKNIIAIGAGISDGLGYGDNAKAALMTRGIKEIASLGIALGGKRESFSGLSGIGDLIVTCTSMHSRNRRCGMLLGQGKSLKEATKEVGMVVEGAFTIKAAHELSIKIGVNMPITNELYKVLYEGADPLKSTNALMMRNKKHELEDIIDLETQWS